MLRTFQRSRVEGFLCLPLMVGSGQLCEGGKKRKCDYKKLMEVHVKAKLSLCLTKHHAMKTYGRVEVWLHTFLASALDGDEWSASRPSRVTPGGKSPPPSIPLNRRLCVDTRVCLDAVAKRKEKPFPTHAQNRTPIVHPVTVTIITELSTKPNTSKTFSYKV
jgi:hypothetical protein